MNWPRVQLKQITSFGPQYGANASGAPWTGTRPRYVRITDINQYGQLIQTDAVEADSEDVGEFTLEEGDLLFARSGNTVGKTYRHTTKNGPCVFAGYLIRFRLNPQLADSKYFFFFTQSTSYKNWVISKKRVAGQPNVNGTEYSSLTFQLPLLREQRRIVELLEQADELRRQRAEADAIAASILSALFYKLFGNPATNSLNWPKTKISSVVTETSYGTSCQSNTNGEGLPVLRMNNITSAGQLNLSDVKHVLLGEGELAKQRLQAGDLLFNRTNTKELVGKTGLWRGQMQAVAASYLIRVRADRAQVLPDYLWAWMNTPYFKQLLFDISRRAVGMANINATELRSMPILVPTLHRQELFAEHLRSLETLADKRKESARSLETLFAVMLHRAFTGELTAEWREAHIKELLAEMEQQTRLLRSSPNGRN